jgi:RNA polymerase sigma-70 factor (ECF subfamily)
MGSHNSDEFIAWQRSLAGDGHAFAVIFDLHYPRVYRHIIWANGSTDDVDDLAAATFMELWRKRDRVRLVDDSVLPWLLVTAGNMARNATRAQHRYRKLLATLPTPDNTPDVSNEVGDRIDAEHRHGELATALKTLPRVDQELISLTTYEGLSLHDSAMAVGISYGAAKTRLSRARRHLSTHLSHLNVQEEGIRS